MSQDATPCGCPVCAQQPVPHPHAASIVPPPNPCGCETCTRGIAGLRPLPVEVRSLGPPPRSCREALDVLALVLAVMPPLAARGFWDVITALRGPDATDALNVKGATTCPVRHAALGILPEVFGAATHAESDGDQLVRNGLPQAAWHFKEHARAAFKALGLTW